VTVHFERSPTLAAISGLPFWGVPLFTASISAQVTPPAPPPLELLLLELLLELLLLELLLLELLLPEEFPPEVLPPVALPPEFPELYSSESALAKFTSRLAWPQAVSKAITVRPVPKLSSRSKFMFRTPGTVVHGPPCL
jgi:hypothetical protein